MNRADAIVTLKAIAAQAEKLAADLTAGRLWEGEYTQAVAQLGRHMRDLPTEPGPH
jgi:hypothetical protein